VLKTFAIKLVFGIYIQFELRFRVNHNRLNSGDETPSENRGGFGSENEQASCFISGVA
jgi:hypothetical protein